MNFVKNLQARLLSTKDPEPLFTFKKDIEFPIYHINLNNKVDYSIVLNNIKIYKELFPESYTTNVYAWRSHYYTHTKTDLFNDLIRILEEIGSHYYCMHGITNLKTKIVNLWAMVYSKGDYAKWHHHGKNILSMVYYVDVDDGTTPIEFNGTNGTITVFPKRGDLIIFDSSLTHRVPKVSNHSPRVVIASNLMLVK